ncbi:MAG: hypothetical protein LLF98_02435 [Clostridium sp.]|uniref:hypothetical protein n=1 Tax=Clostridium sp. TaxID=1506 RepID=UPI0025C3C00F|nr:hypothetical protein [Clostridium sp.]MCE5220140.1 hypothetical protein [Clostridium sp.]
MKIIIKDQYQGDVEIDVRKNYGGKVYEKGSMLCRVSPWSASGCPLTLEIAITPTGEILFREWDWSGLGNYYLHTIVNTDIEVTEAMSDTVSGLFSGRIKFEGIKIAVGASVQEICPINIEKEERLIGKKIYLA